MSNFVRRLACLPLAMMGVGCFPAFGAELSQPLKVLLSVGPEGEHHTEASAAWNLVASADVEELPVVLAALDEANPLAANWLHAAVDTIASRHLKASGPPPLGPLEKFLAETQHAPRGRRLAFDWLVKFDPTARERLVPGFLNDPCLELRREAVEQLLAQGNELLAADDSEEAKSGSIEVYRRALTAARDLDQIETIAKQLQSLDQEVDLPRHLGFVTEWRLIGSFDNTAEKGFDVIYPPEEEIKFDAEYPGKEKAVSWREHTTADPYGVVDLNAALGKANGVAGYAVAEFNSPSEQEIELRMGCVCANKVWLNGKLLMAHNVYHAGEKIDQYVSRGTLHSGRNLILVKVLQNEQPDVWAQDWRFQLRVCDSLGTAVLSQDRRDRKQP